MIVESSTSRSAAGIDRAETATRYQSWLYLKMERSGPSVDPRHQRARCDLAQLMCGLIDAGQIDRRECGGGRVVEADDREILGYAHAG